MDNVQQQDVVYFAHGKEGTPWGRKIERLAEVARRRGFHVESPDYTDIPDPDRRVEMLLARAPIPARRLVLVGSSMGAYLSVVASRKLRPDGLFLMSPALYLWDYADQDPHPHARVTVVVHGWRDDVVPPANSVRFAQKHRATLHMVDSDHRLLDALPFLTQAFDWFLGQVGETNGG
ncbi:MAG: alpha/beta hydrolase [Magnetococcales bacterium]|nr:alpha/beta hydrolase [Magnetococcales bacterium]